MRKLTIEKTAASLVFLSLLFVISIAPVQDFAQAAATTIESMPGESPVPLIAVPEDFFFRVIPSSERLSLLAQLSTFSINYISGGTNYFGDTCISWPTEARNAFDYAAGIWATYLQSSVPITINACWSTSLPSGVLGHSASRNFFRNFSGAPITDTRHPVSLANALQRSDLDLGVAGMPSSLLFLVTALVWGFGTSMFAANPEGQSPVLETVGLSSPSSAGSGVSMRVLWTISEYKVGENAVWGEEEARKMLFKPLDIDANRITFDGNTCSNVIFEKEKVNAKEYLDRVYHTTPRALGIEDKVVEVVKTNCDLPGFGEYMRLSDRRLIIHLNGVFFYFNPAVNY